MDTHGEGDERHDAGALAPALRAVEVDRVGEESAGSGRRRPTKFTRENRILYLRLIRQGVRRVRAAALCGVRYQTVRDYMRAHPEFLRGVEEAEASRLDEVEEALYRTALDGDTRAALAILGRRRRAEWGDLGDHEDTAVGAGGGARRVSAGSVHAPGLATAPDDEDEVAFVDEAAAAARMDLESKLAALSERLVEEDAKASSDGGDAA